MGSLVIFLTSDRRSEFRSTTCVAPSDFKKSVFFVEAVVMIGEKPESFANWMPKSSRRGYKVFENDSGR